MAKIISVKNGDTKTLTIKKDSVIKFTDIKEEVLTKNSGKGSPFDFIRNGKNLIIKNDAAKISITVKNFFTTKNHGAYTKSKLSGLLFQDSTEVIGMGKNYIQNNADYKQFEFDSKNNSAYATMFWDTIDLSGNEYKSNENLKIYTGLGKDTIKFAATTANSSERTIYARNDTNPTILNLTYMGTGKIKDISNSKGSLVFKSNTGKEIYTIDKYISKGQDNVSVIVTEKVNNQNKDNTYSLKDYLNNNIKKVFDIGKNTAKKQTLKGSFLNNNFIGCKGKDKIYCVDGNNTVTGRGGNDIIYAGKGADTFKYTAYDYGKDKIYNATSADTIYITDDKNVTGMYSPFSYVKSGNNLIIQSEVWNDRKRKYVASDSITLVNYFKADKGKSINEKDRLVNIKDSDSKTTKLTDIEIEVNAAKGTHNLGKGIFDINYKKGNTTLVAHSSSTLYITEKNGQIIDYDKQKKGNDLVLTCADVKYNIKKHREVISKKGTITIKDYFKSNSDGTSSISMTNAKKYLEFNGKTYDFYEPYSSSSNSGTYIHTTSATKKADGYNIYEGMGGNYNNWITGTKKNDRIVTKNQSVNLFDMRGGNDIVDASANNVINRFCYSAGFDRYTSGNKKDVYMIGMTVYEADSEYDNTGVNHTGFSKNSKVHIKDKGGDSDFMSIAAKQENLRLLFNVTKDNKISGSESLNYSKNSGNWDSLMIFDKSALTGKNIQSNNYTGVIEIDDWFKADGSKGTGYIESVGIAKIGGSYDKINIDSWIDSVKGEVVKWLQANNKGSVAEVLNGTDKTAINSLVSVFTGKSY